MKSTKSITLSYPGPTKGLTFTGDWHWGHERCNTEGVLESLRRASEHDDAILLMGDLGDYGLTGSVGASAYEQRLTPQEQAEVVESLVQPYRERIVGVITGNHEERIRVRTSLDVSRMLATNLGVPYLGFGGIVRLVVGGRGFTIFAKHGRSGAGTLGGKIAAIMKYRHLVPDADVYAMGHVHHLMHQPSEVRSFDTRNKVVRPRTQHFILTGHYLDYEDSYAEVADYFPGAQGSPRVIFGQDGQIDVRL